MISSGFLSGLTPFPLSLWLLGLLCLFIQYFLFGRAVGFMDRIYKTSNWSPQPYLKRFLEFFISVVIWVGVPEILEILEILGVSPTISISKEVPGAIFFGLMLVGFMAGYVHDRWAHGRQGQKKESLSEEGLPLVEICDCKVCERRRRQATRKRG